MVTAHITWRELVQGLDDIHYIMRSKDLDARTWEITAEQACYFIEEHSQKTAMREIRVRFDCDFD